MMEKKKKLKLVRKVTFVPVFFVLPPLEREIKNNVADASKVETVWFVGG